MAETCSQRSSGTEEDLEEARQRLLDHMEVNENGRYNEDLTHSHGSLGNPGTILPDPVHNHFPNGIETQQQHMRANYGSFASVGSLVSQTKRKPPSSKRYRLPFLILLGFDWGMVIFFSIVVMHEKLKNYFDLHIQNNYFDLVIIGTYRVVLNILFYLVLGWVTRIVMAVTTLTSALYIPIKAYYTWNSITADGLSLTAIATFMMLIITFGMPWITAFFFEFKYLPAELARLEIRTWWDWRAWLWPMALVKKNTEDAPSLPDVAERTPVPSRLGRPRGGFSASTVSLDFRTPIGSSRASPVPFDRHGDDDLPPIREDQEFTSSTEYQSPECDQVQTRSAEDLRFKREALSALEEFKRYSGSNDGWTTERIGSSMAIYSQVVDRRKIWKLEGLVNTSARQLFHTLYPGEQTSEWNPQCLLSETVYRVDDSTDLIYSVTTSVGPVSSRDFLSIRQIEMTSNGWYYSASKSIISAMKPEQPGKVRGENGPCGYLVIPVDSNKSKLIWVINSNIKGWMPQSVIDQTIVGVIASSFEKLMTFAQHYDGGGRHHH